MNVWHNGLAVAVVCWGPFVWGQGALQPAGAPAPVMKNLDQVEARIPISSIPTNITMPGSYYLTQNLVMPAMAQNGINVVTNDVTIDLNGYCLQGNATGYNGIYLPVDNMNLVVQNGVISDWTHALVYRGLAGDGSGIQVENVRFVRNRNGLKLGARSIMSGCSVISNLGYGAFMETQGRAMNCQVRFNGQTGLVAGTDCVISQCVMDHNGGIGIKGDDRCLVDACTAFSNGIAGISLGYNAVARNCAAGGNAGTGISVQNSGLIEGCTSYNNASWGLFGNYGAILRNSTVWLCDLGIGGNQITVENCTARECVDEGMRVGNNSTIRKCVVDENGGDGIQAGSNGFITENKCCDNMASGINLTQSGSTVRNTVVDGNVAINNAKGGIEVSGDDNLIIKNRATNNGTNFSVAVNNHLSEVVTLAGSGFTNLNPWANFNY